MLAIIVPRLKWNSQMPAQIRVCGGSHGYSRQGTMKTPGNQCNPPESESFAAAAVQVIISGFTPPGPRQKAWFSKADGGTPQPAGDAGNVERREESRGHGDEATCVVHSLAMPPAVVSIAVRCWSWGTTFTAGSVWRGSGRESVTDARTVIRAASPPPDHRGLPFRCSRSRTTGWSRLVWWEFQRESSGQAWVDGYAHDPARDGQQFNAWNHRCKEASSAGDG